MKDMMHKDRNHRATGGVNEAREDLDDKPERRVNSKINSEAEERKRGGATHGPDCPCCKGGMPKRRRRGGKTVGMVHGEMTRHHAGRKPRKSGGSADSMPFSSARKGDAPKGRTLDMEMEGE
jgi:hypothetical protein